MTPGRGFDEEGLTLVELLVTLAVSSVVVAFVSATVVNALRAQDRQQAQLAALSEAKIAFERLSRELRVADPLRVAEPERIRLDSDAGGGAARTLTYERVGDRLLATDAATGQATALVGALAAGEPLFRYHLFDGSTATGGAALDPRSVRSVTVRLRVQPEGATQPIDLENRVLLRNARE